MQRVITEKKQALATPLPGPEGAADLTASEPMPLWVDRPLALVGAWYETMALMLRNDPAAKAALASMAKASGTDPAGFDSQLATTHLFSTPAEAYAFMTGDALIKTMDLVRRFSYEHGILGQGAASPDVVGIQFPAGKRLGDAGNIKMRLGVPEIECRARSVEVRNGGSHDGGGH